MFTSFDESKFWKAIEEKDYLRLKVNTFSTILNDPTFERGETERILKILEERVPEIFEDEVMLNYEERLEPDAWDKRYFTKLTYWFRENFAKSRVAYIKKVGQVVHKDTVHKEIRPETEPSPNPTETPEKQKKLPMVGVIAAVGALVLLVALLVKLLER